jgi:hypothetical protein
VKRLSLVCCGLFLACSQDVKEAPGTAAFSDLFVLVEVIPLEESPTDPIVDVDRISVGADGMMVVADRRANRVRVFGSDGRTKATIGRKGGGPGEFDGLLDVVITASEFLYASDAGTGRISRFDPGLAYDTAFHPPGLFAAPLAELDGDLVAAVFERSRGTVWRLAPDGTPRHEIVVPDSTAWRIPYWAALLTREMTLLQGNLVISNSLLYPLWRVSPGAAYADSFGWAPASFREASRPARGQFVGARQTEVWEWLTTFSVIARMVSYRDSLLVVVHGEYQPEEGEPWRRVHQTMDIYGQDGRKRYTEVTVPGHVLSGGDYLYALVAEPPAPWTVAKFEFARGTDEGASRSLTRR